MHIFVATTAAILVAALILANLRRTMQLAVILAGLGLALIALAGIGWAIAANWDWLAARGDFISYAIIAGIVALFLRVAIPHWRKEFGGKKDKD